MAFLHREDPSVEVTVSVSYDIVSVYFLHLRVGFYGSNRWLRSNDSGEQAVTTPTRVLKVWVVSVHTCSTLLLIALDYSKAKFRRCVQGILRLGFPSRSMRSPTYDR